MSGVEQKTPQKGDGGLRPHHVAQALPVLVQCGFRFAIDWDDSLIVTPPERLDADYVVQLIAWADANGEAVTRAVRMNARLVRGTFSGGSLDGRQTWCYQSAYHVLMPGYRRYHLHHAGRGRWEVYRLEDDGRGYYLGSAPNKKKALVMFDERTRSTTTEE